MTQTYPQGANPTRNSLRTNDELRWRDSGKGKLKLNPETTLTIDNELSLEQMIDAHGLDTILTTIREICYAKANHIAVQDQDVALAKLWIAYAMYVNSAVQKVGR